MLYALCFLLFMIGLYCALVKKNMVRIVLGIVIMEYAVNILLIMIGFRIGGEAPILSPPQGLPLKTSLQSVDPLPQALVLTAIVISLGSLALMVSICIRTYQRYGTFDITQIRRLRG
ncbi:MAG: NADH-quinone oxidoreductase subunit K [Sedimentisphaerales bacterium]|nr:NADH-quinone oxidoreductase subunit K [Sedimentisphaerales bacterium]